MKLQELKARSKAFVKVLDLLDDSLLESELIDADENFEERSIRCFTMNKELSRKVAGLFVLAGFEMKVSKVHAANTSLRATFPLGDGWTAYVDSYMPRTCKLITKQKRVEATPYQPAQPAQDAHMEDYQVLECSDGKKVTEKAVA